QTALLWRRGPTERAARDMRELQGQPLKTSPLVNLGPMFLPGRHDGIRRFPHSPSAVQTIVSADWTSRNEYPSRTPINCSTVTFDTRRRTNSSEPVNRGVYSHG